MTAGAEQAERLATFLGRQPPFAGLGADFLAELAAAAEVRTFSTGDLVLDAFATPTAEVFVVITGNVELWNDADRTLDAPDERLGPGGVFGFSAMLTERSVGPRVVARSNVTVAALPAGAVEPVFSSAAGARFLAGHLSTRSLRPVAANYSLVEDLITTEPLVVAPDDHVCAVAARMTERGLPYAAVELGDGAYGLVTDARLRRRVLVDGVDGHAPISEVMTRKVPIAGVGESAAAAQIALLDRQAEFLLVTDRSGALRGVVGYRDFAVSPTTVGVSLHEQLRRATTVEELRRRARRVPPTLSDLLSRGLSSSRVIAVYSAIVDTVVRRSISLVFADHPDLSVDDFTWMSLGSNGRRETVLSSDVDSAVTFVVDLDDAKIARYREAFASVEAVLAGAGLSSDGHGATASKPAFSRTESAWRAAARSWLAAPEKNQGAIMTSLMVDGRPIHGDPGLPTVTKVFSDLRAHPGTMRLLLQESLSRRAKLHSVRDVLTRRADTFDIKTYALLPIVNLARWAALTVNSAALSTVERLEAAGGSEMLPEEQARNLIEVFEVLQRLRLRYQLLAHQRGGQPSDILDLDRLSAIDRSIITQAVREIAAVQRRMDNVAVYTPPSAWTSPANS